FCFITIACGAISGFHTLISSGITPKIITREQMARPVGYGAMCLESLVAIMAIIAACTLDPGVYLAMNVKGAGPNPAAVVADTVAKVNAQGPIYQVDPQRMETLAKEVGEETLYGRTGGAATLAVGMANIFSRVTQGRWLDLWYHFAIMFEALFILTTLDAGTRVGRYLLQDGLGHLWKPLGDTRSLAAGVFASALIVAAWGVFLIQGVRDPLGGINSLWPLFGIANQLLAAIALCLATTIILKMVLRDSPGGKRKSPALVLVTLVPLAWLLAVTFTAGWQKIFDPSPKIGFLVAAKALDDKLPALQQSLTAAEQIGGQKAIDAAAAALHTNRGQHFNTMLDAWVAGILLALVLGIVLISLVEWLLLLGRKKLVELRETEPVFLSIEQADPAKSPVPALGAIALAFALAKELSGQAEIEREANLAQSCECREAQPARARQNVYLTVSSRRFKSVRRCC
ncbi:MAG TPA: carbon starvation CstA 5TM domain-containing protein, partial [Chthoniobacteraceae bacterium]